jgi:hypothetical protein
VNRALKSKMIIYEDRMWYVVYDCFIRVIIKLHSAYIYHLGYQEVIIILVLHILLR